MSSTDKTKLNGIATGATKNIVDSSLSSTSSNPIANKAVYTALSGKIDSDRIAVIESVTPSSGSNYIDLPNGFTVDNTVIIGVLMNQGSGITTINGSGLSFWFQGARLFVAYNNVNAFDIKIILFKY